ncbi:hypothetical protein FRC17_004427 [Serendipita sp. 399]|nr:hypothetical protein FRC17_004427 [Serendipita sp. 399]
MALNVRVIYPSSSKRQAQPPVHPRSPKTLSSIAEHPVSPKLERRESKSVSFSLNPMESPFAPTRTATHAGYINRQVSMPVHAPMYSSSSSSSTFFHSSPTSFPSDLRYQTPPLFRPGPPPLDDEPNVGCGSSSLALVTYMFKRFKKVSSNNNNSHKKDDSPHSHAPNSNHKKLRRTATAPVEREEKRPNRRGYYRFTDEEMEQQNLTRGQLMAWRENRVRSHILHDGDFLYQGSNNNSQMGYQGVPVSTDLNYWTGILETRY